MNRAFERLLSVLALTTAMAVGGVGAARAQGMETTRDLTSVRALGMGGAARGFASANESLLLNPAAIAATVRFNLTGTGLFDGANGFRVLGIDAVDSQLNAEEAFAVAGGLGYYSYRSGKGAEARSGSMTALGLALPLLPEVLFLGATVRYLNLSGAVHTRAATADAAVMARLSPAIAVSGIGYGLINVRSPEVRRSWAIGFAAGSDDQYHLDIDVRFDTDAQNRTREAYLVGAEYLIGGVVMPRAGFDYDALRNAREVSGGVSVLVSGLAIEGAYRHQLNGPGRTVGVALRVLSSFL